MGAPVDIGAEFFTGDGTVGQALDLHGAVEGQWPLFVNPLAHRLRTYLKEFRQLGGRTKVIHSDLNAHGNQCTAMLTLHQALVAYPTLFQNQVMLTAREKLAKILAEDLGRRAMPKVDRAALAHDCEISRQAISNWIKTGRVEKEHLVIVARHTGKAIARYMPSSDKPVIARYPAIKGATHLLAQEPPPDQTMPTINHTITRITTALAALEPDHLEVLADQIERDAAISRQLRDKRARKASGEH